MNVRILKACLNGDVSVCASKSEAHRMLISAALSSGKTRIICSSMSEDILATASCVEALGVKVSFGDGFIDVESEGRLPEGEITLDCGESGSTIRFMIPVAAALHANATFTGHGRLPLRTNAPLIKTLKECGAEFDKEDGLPLRVSGNLKAGTFEIPGNISSQYISGLLFSLPLLEGDSKIVITEKLESAPYIKITLDVLSKFGIFADFDEENQVIYVKGNQKYISPKEITVSGDWSNGAFFVVGNELAGNSIKCLNLDRENTLQGDSAILDVVKKVKEAELFSEITIDCRQIPDLVPIISVLAASRTGKTIITGAERLRIKESDRIKTVKEMLYGLGGIVQETADGLIITGVGGLMGGIVEASGDHRIAMSAAIAASICKSSVTIRNAEAVNKSYPAFFDVYESLGGQIVRE